MLVALVVTVDSEIGIVAWYYAIKLEIHLMVQIGTGSQIRIIDVGNNRWNPNVIEGLPSLQAFSGCDEVSACNGIGNIKWLSAVRKPRRIYGCHEVAW